MNPGPGDRPDSHDYIVAVDPLPAALAQGRDVVLSRGGVYRCLHAVDDVVEAVILELTDHCLLARILSICGRDGRPRGGVYLLDGPAVQLVLHSDPRRVHHQRLPRVLQRRACRWGLPTGSYQNPKRHDHPGSARLVG